MQGKLLVASPKQDSGMFARTVCLITEHSRKGTTGVVLNRPSGTTVSKLMSEVGVVDAPNYDELIYMGGPIRERNISMLHSNDWYSASTSVVNEHFSVSYDNFMLEKMAMNNTP